MTWWTLLLEPIAWAGYENGYNQVRPMGPFDTTSYAWMQHRLARARRSRELDRIGGLRTRP